MEKHEQVIATVSSFAKFTMHGAIHVSVSVALQQA